MSNTDVGGAWGEPRPTTGGGAAGNGGSAKEMAAGAAQAVKQEAASFAQDARGKATEKLEQHKQTASQTLGDFANAIRKAGDELAQTDQSLATRLVRQAADGLEGFARSVSDKRPEELLDAVRDFGRRNPTAFIAGSVLAGLALGRFLTSSSAAAQGASMRAPATFSSFEGGTPDVGLTDPTMLGAAGASMDAAGLADPAAVGATSIGAPSGAGLSGEAEVALGDPQRVVEDSGVLSTDDERRDAAGSTDPDRARFGPGS